MTLHVVLSLTVLIFLSVLGIWKIAQGGSSKAYLVGVMTLNDKTPNDRKWELTHLSVYRYPALNMGKPGQFASYYVTLLESEDCQTFGAAYLQMAEMFPKMLPELAKDYPDIVYYARVFES